MSEQIQPTHPSSGPRSRFWSIWGCWLIWCFWSRAERWVTAWEIFVLLFVSKWQERSHKIRRIFLLILLHVLLEFISPVICDYLGQGHSKGLWDEFWIKKINISSLKKRLQPYFRSTGRHIQMFSRELTSIKTQKRLLYVRGIKVSVSIIK